LEHHYPNLTEYARGHYLLLNYEILFYLIRDKVDDKPLKARIKKAINKNLKYIGKSKFFYKMKK